VLGVTELKLVLEGLAEARVMSATPTELAVGEVEVEEGDALSVAMAVLVLEAWYEFSPP